MAPSALGDGVRADVLAQVVRAATGRPDADPGSVDRPFVVEGVNNMTTEAIERLRGSLADGTRWSVVAKRLRPASAAPAFAFVPEEHRATVTETLNWRDEPRVYRCGLDDRLPAGFRMPKLYRTDEEPDRITLWLEDVPDRVPWTADRYRRTARCLGAMAGRWSGSRAAEELGMGGRDLATMFFGKISNLDLPLQADDAFWRRPAVAAVVGRSHRADLFRLARLMPALLARLDELPAGLCHGDACPANFLEPGDGSLVGIDWSYCHVGALGSDLGQLLAGRFESGTAAADDLGEIATSVREGYLEGLAAEGLEVDETALEQAWATHLAVRSVFSALVVEPAAGSDDDDRLDLLRERAALGRFGLDLALRHATRW